MKDRVIGQIKKIQAYWNKHWFKVGLTCLLVYVLVNKDISFQLSMSNQNNAPIAQVQPAVNLPEAMEEMNLGNTLTTIVKKITPEPAKVIATEPAPKPVEKDNKANHFHNISAIISPLYLQKKGLSHGEIEAMKAICIRYVKRFAPVAQAEMKKYGVPASIKLAQALLESDAGNSRLAKANNNHFGIKCFNKTCNKSHCSNFTDDTHKDFFRKYQNAWESFRAHSQLVSGKRYQHLKKLGTKDYKAWAYGLRKAGYATDKRYAEKLVEIIETLDLHEYDQ